jgi:hypothetical protein
MAVLWCVVLLLCTQLSNAARGVDFAGAMSSDKAKCLVNAGYGDFAMVRAWHSYGAFDTDAPASIAALRGAGFKDIDVYMFPCPTKDVGQQVKDMISNLIQQSVNFGGVWLDIEENPSTNCGWSSNKATNCATMSRLASAINSTGLFWGTYASEYEWSTLMGTDCVVPLAAQHELWYPHYERPPNPSFSDFKPFGGWRTPTIKQYDDTDGGKCAGSQVDVSWRP